jgi:virulence-associated protein VagC
VSIVREGKRLVIVPSKAAWDDFFDSQGSELTESLYPKDIPVVPKSRQASTRIKARNSKKKLTIDRL